GVQRGHGDRAAERELRVADRNGEGDVVRVALRPAEDPMRGDVHPHVQVPSGRAAAARFALPLEPDLLPVLHPGRDAHGDRAGAGAHALATAFGAGVVDDPARAAAVAARLGERERALAAADQTDAAARGAGARGAPRPRPGAATAFAATRRGQPQLHLGAAHGVDEVDPQLALDVGAPPAARGRGGARAPAAEQTAEQVTESTGAGGAPEQVVQVEAGAGGGPEPTREPAAGEPAATTGEERARLVVLATLLLVGQHPVRLGDPLEPGLGLGVAGVGIRVQLTGEPPVRLLDLVGRSVGGHAQLAVVVLLDPVPLGHP